MRSSLLPWLHILGPNKIILDKHAYISTTFHMPDIDFAHEWIIVPSFFKNLKEE